MNNGNEIEAGYIEKQQRADANLLAIIENADGIVYSLDKDFRFITLNSALKNMLWDRLGIEAKTGDRIYEFLEKNEPDEARYWHNIYQQAIHGKHLKFVKEFTYGGKSKFWSFSINPIIQNGKTTGLACFGRDITEIRLQRQKAESEMLAINASLEEKVAERTAQLEQVNGELEAFSYTVAHDLKAPLRVIGGFINLLIKNNKHLLSEESCNYLKLSQQNVQHMGHLVQDLLDFSRIQKIQLAAADVDMQLLVNEVKSTIAHYEPSHKCIININQLLPCKGDTALLKQVWTNLLSNAVKYSANVAQPVVEIGCTQSKGETTYYIKDNGAGFDMNNAGKLFDAFHRLHHRSEFEGTGVGLALVKRIIARHKGKIWALAEVNKGATFYFTIPDAN